MWETTTLRHALRDIEQWRRVRGIKKPLQYIFDWQEIGSDIREEIDDVVGQMCEHYKEEGHQNLKKKKLAPGLQTVDLIAWLTMQLGMNIFRDKPMEGLAGE